MFLKSVIRGRSPGDATKMRIQQLPAIPLVAPSSSQLRGTESVLACAGYSGDSLAAKSSGRLRG